MILFNYCLDSFWNQFLRKIFVVRKMNLTSHSPQQQHADAATTEVTLRWPRKSIEEENSSPPVGLDCLELRRRNSSRIRSWDQAGNFYRNRPNSFELPPHQNQTNTSNKAATDKERIRRIRSLGRYSRKNDEGEELLSIESLRNKPPRPPTAELTSAVTSSGRISEAANNAEAEHTKSEPKELKYWRPHERLSRTSSSKQYTCEMPIVQIKVIIYFTKKIYKHCFQSKLFFSCRALKYLYELEFIPTS